MSEARTKKDVLNDIQVYLTSLPPKKRLKVKIGDKKNIIDTKEEALAFIELLEITAKGLGQEELTFFHEKLVDSNATTFELDYSDKKIDLDSKLAGLAGLDRSKMGTVRDYKKIVTVELEEGQKDQLKAILNKFN